MIFNQLVNDVTKSRRFVSAALFGYEAIDLFFSEPVVLENFTNISR